MKQLLTILLVLLSVVCKAQTAELKKDTVYYNGAKIAKGDTVQIWYGSSDKKFVYVNMGSALTGITPLDPQFAKYKVLVDRVYRTDGKCYARGKVLNSSVNALGGNKVFIDIEGAIDNSEIKVSSK